MSATVPSFREIEYFLAAVEAGSTSGAARALFVSQSAVSTGIASLERSLGVALFLRLPGEGLRLTRAGHRLAPRARALFNDLTSLSDMAHGLASDIAGTLSIGCYTTLSPIWLPKLINAMEQRYPGIKLDILEGDADRLRALLHDGRCEAVLMYDYKNRPDDALRKVVVGQAPAYVILPPDHRLARRATVRLRDLVKEPMIVYDGAHAREYVERLAAESGLELLVRQETSNFETVRALVAAGRGYAILNQRPAFNTTYDGGEVCAVDLADELSPLEIAVIYPDDAHPIRRIQAFVDIARDVVSP